MRRSLLIFSCALVGVGMGLAVFLALREDELRRPEFRLGNGPRIRVEAVTWGTNQQVRLEPALWSELKQRVPVSWRKHLGTPQPARRLVGSQYAHLWLSGMDAIQGGWVRIPVMSCIHVEPSGREVRSRSWTGYGPGRAAEARTLEVVDWRAATLRFRFEAGGQTQEVSLPNPRLGEEFPVWEPQALPQSREQDGFTMVLHEILAESHGRWEWKPRVTVTQGGRDVTDWFELQRTFCDPTGNRSPSGLPSSERVWRLEMLAYPAENYPVPDREMMVTETVPVPGPGEYRIFSLGESAKRAGLEWICLMGPGYFAFQDGTNRVARAGKTDSGRESSSLGASGWESSLHRERWIVQLLYKRPSTTGGLPTLGSGLARTRVRARLEDGTRIQAVEGGNSTSDDGTQIISMWTYELPQMPERGNVALEHFVAEPLKAEFTFAAPAAPRATGR